MRKHIYYKVLESKSTINNQYCKSRANERMRNLTIQSQNFPLL
ncbi:hypothetical protein CAPGI0001_1815 [Capnocytophaga gingivalis ATCC 33624]|nr:hypothetical protein CAPGI0001_1815 [Capnocytophaga gingivalis ATCC 33624]